MLDHDAATPAATVYGDDYLAGGAGDDMIFGQLGNDTIQGDGSIDQTVGACRLGAAGTCTGRSRDLLVVRRAPRPPPTATTTSRAAAAAT